jgi:hypothetical protein
LLFFVMVPCQVTTAMADLYACSRYIYGLSRGGFIPTKLSITYTGDPKNLTRKGADNSSATQSKTSQSMNLSVIQSVQIQSTLSSHSTVNTVDTALEQRDRVNSLIPGPRVNRIFSHISGISFRPPAPPPSLVNGGSAYESRRFSMPWDRGSEYTRSPKYAVVLAGLMCLLFNILVEIFRLSSKSSSADGDGMLLNFASDNLLRMAVWFACLGYSIQLLSYMVIRIKMSTLLRPCPSPTGIPGVLASLTVALAFGLIGPFFVPNPQVYIICVMVIGGFSALYFVYYQVYALPRLANSPERLFISYVFPFFCSHSRHKCKF